MTGLHLDKAKGIQAQHVAELDAGRFLIQHCAACGKHIYFPREVCPHCGSEELALVEPKGTGTVYATTTVRRKAGEGSEGGDINVSLIDLDEGVRLMSRVANVAPESVRIGQRVKSRVQTTDGHGIVVFDALDGEAA